MMIRTASLPAYLPGEASISEARKKTGEIVVCPFTLDYHVLGLRQNGQTLQMPLLHSPDKIVK